MFWKISLWIDMFLIQAESFLHNDLIIIVNVIFTLNLRLLFLLRVLQGWFRQTMFGRSGIHSVQDKH